MCLIALAWNTVPKQPLLLLANRDEFHARPTAPLAWWPDHPTLLAGRDQKEGGTWLGASRGGRVAAVTNVRGADIGAVHPRSRGALVRDFLLADAPAAAWAAALEPGAIDYGGFNLLLFDGRTLVHASNRPRFSWQEVEPGFHGLSNAALDTPWPKVERARAGLASALARGGDDGALLDLMRDEHPAPDADLPDTGVGLDWERRLSPAFICSQTYGTRTTTLLRAHADGRVDLLERSFDPRGDVTGEVARAIPAPRA